MSQGVIADICSLVMKQGLIFIWWTNTTLVQIWVTPGISRYSSYRFQKWEKSREDGHSCGTSLLTLPLTSQPPTVSIFTTHQSPHFSVVGLSSQHSTGALCVGGRCLLCFRSTTSTLNWTLVLRASTYTVTLIGITILFLSLHSFTLRSKFSNFYRRWVCWGCAIVCQT